MAVVIHRQRRPERGRSRTRGPFAPSPCAAAAHLKLRRPFEASGSLLPSRVQSLQQPSRDITNPFHLSCVAPAFHKHQQIRSAVKCPTKTLKELTK